MLDCKGEPLGEFGGTVPCDIICAGEWAGGGGADQSGGAVGGSFSICHRDAAHKDLLEAAR